MATFASIPSPFEIALTHLELARLGHRRGTAAADHLAEAQRGFRALGVGEYERRAAAVAERVGLGRAT